MDAGAAYWNRVADRKAFSHPFDLARFAALVPRNARILDYGCGYGRLCGELLRAEFVDVIGVDVAERMIERARAAQPTGTFELVAELPLPFRASLFDAVLLFSVLTCIPADDDQRAVVTELVRVLRPAGILYVSDILLQDDDRNRLRYAAWTGGGPYGTFELEPGAIFRHLSREWVQDLFAPFEPVDFRVIPIVTMNGHAAQGFQYFGRRF